jgi:carbon storage regulator
MLVLSRKRDQRIIVGGEIRITVVDVKGDTVQLGIDAPRKIPIYREEIYAAIQSANEEASRDPDQAFEKLGRPKPPHEQP